MLLREGRSRAVVVAQRLELDVLDGHRVRFRLREFGRERTELGRDDGRRVERENCGDNDKPPGSTSKGKPLPASS